MSTEEIIAHAANCQKVKDQVEAEYKLCCDALEARFPAIKFEEEIITPFGVATRKVTNAWLVAEKKADTLIDMFGRQVGEFVEQGLKVKIAKGQEEHIWRMLGPEHDDLFVVDPTYKILPKLRNLFTLPVTRGVGEIDLAPIPESVVEVPPSILRKVAPCIVVHQKTVVTVKPIDAT